MKFFLMLPEQKLKHDKKQQYVEKVDHLFTPCNSDNIKQKVSFHTNNNFFQSIMQKIKTTSTFKNYFKTTRLNLFSKVENYI